MSDQEELNLPEHSAYQNTIELLYLLELIVLILGITNCSKFSLDTK